MAYFVDLRGHWRGVIITANKRLSKSFPTREEAEAWEKETRGQNPALVPWGTKGGTTSARSQRDANRARDRRNRFMPLLGPCYFCGSTENLQMHHMDPSQKKTHRIWNYREEVIMEELSKCVALCETCHNKFEHLLTKKSIKHGTVSGYDEYRCRCRECTDAKMAKKNSYKN